MLGPCDKQNFKNFLDLVVLVNVETIVLITFCKIFSKKKHN